MSPVQLFVLCLHSSNYDKDTQPIQNKKPDVVSVVMVFALKILVWQREVRLPQCLIQSDNGVRVG